MRDASILLFESLSTVIVSAASNTTLFPDINSRDDPWGIGAFFNNLTSSVDGLVIPTPTRQPETEVFASVIPITTVVVALGTT